MSIEPEVVIRRSWQSVTIWFGPLLLLFVAFAVINQLTFSGDDWLGAAIWSSMIAILLIEAIAFKQMSVVLREDALLVRNLRRSEIPVGRIRGVRVRQGGYFTPYVVEILDGQRAVALRVTTAGWKRNRSWTDEQLHLVGQWWLARGGAEQARSTPR